MIGPFAGEYAFLSNFFPAPMTYEGRRYATSEHAYQSARTRDAAAREAIRHAPSPGKAKRLGRRVIVRDDWDRVKETVMLDVLRAKFGDERLRALLVATRDHDLVERNHWHDNVWGDCTCGGAACAPAGRNALGRALMRVRAEACGRATPSNAEAATVSGP